MCETEVEDQRKWQMGDEWINPVDYWLTDSHNKMPLDFSQFGAKCASCNRVIQPTDWVRRARIHIYHLACFSCTQCKRYRSFYLHLILTKNSISDNCRLEKSLHCKKAGFCVSSISLSWSKEKMEWIRLNRRPNVFELHLLRSSYKSCRYWRISKYANSLLSVLLILLLLLLLPASSFFPSFSFC